MSSRSAPIRPAKSSKEPLERPQASKVIDRERVSHACELCREKRARCNGERPSCQRCQKLRVECRYGLAKNDRRKKEIEDLNNRIAQYESLLEGIAPQLGDETRLKIRALQQDPVRTSSPRSSQMHTPNVLDGEAESYQSGSSDGQYLSPIAARSPPYEDRAHQSLQSVLEESTALRYDGEGLPMPRAPVLSLSKTVTDWQERLLPLSEEHSVPPREITERAVKAFFEGSQVLFEFFDEHEMNELFQSVYESPASTDRNVALCQLSVAAAVGCQYDWDQFSSSTAKALLAVAKLHLEECIERDSLCAMRVMALLCMYFTFEKRVSALVYVDVGLRIARLQKIDVMVPTAQSVKWKRIWCSLVFLSCWLSATIGQYPDQADRYFHPSMFDYGSPVTSMSETVQLEMCKIAIITGKILRDVYHAPTLSTDVVGMYKAELESWLFGLPGFMRLDSLLENGSVGSHLRPIFLVHLLYLSTMTLIYRRILSEFADRPQSLISGTTMDDIKSHLDACLWSSRQVARILTVAMSSGAVLRKCWMFIHATYCACNILLYFAANKLLQNPSFDTIAEDIVASSQCVQILEYCSEADDSAMQFLRNVRPLHNALADIYATSIPAASSSMTRRRSIVSLSSLISSTREAPPPDFPAGEDILKIQDIVVSAIELLLRHSNGEITPPLRQSTTPQETLAMYADMGIPFMSLGDMNKSAADSLQHYFWGDTAGREGFTGSDNSPSQKYYEDQAKAAMPMNDMMFGPR